MRWHVISAVFWRNLQQYFSSVLGYLFIVVFVTCCAVATFSPQFFADNLANVDQLSRWFSLLLLVFVPAITMGVWSDEKRQGTDSILFTLPASDFDITIGKYLSVVAVYTVALLFSTTQLIALAFLGNPDWGVLFTTYLGYWLAGVALIAVGMFASSLSESPTVAFILGALLCATPILIGRYFSNYLLLEQFGIDWHLSDFTLGLIPLSSVVYFLGVTVFMLYLNLVAISERRWKPSSKTELLFQYIVRAICLAVILVSLGNLLNNNGAAATAQIDFTSEKLYTLDQATLQTLEKIEQDDQVIDIDAFVSSDIPRKYVNTKKQLLGMLKQYREHGGNNINVRIVEVSPNSKEATDARLKGIEPRADRSDENGRIVETDVFLGAYVSGPQRSIPLPFFEQSDTLEYELSRSIDSAYQRGDKVTLGILESDAFFGGPEVEGRRLPWAYNEMMGMLKQEYSIKHIKGDRLGDYVSTAGDESNLQQLKAPDVMLVADPASLTASAMADLIRYIEQGHPTLILGDPLPFHWTSLAPRQLGILNAPQMPRVNRNSRFAPILASSPEPKADGGNAGPLSEALGIEWNTGQTVWNLDDPHTDFRGSWQVEALGAVWPTEFGPYEKVFTYIRNQDEQVLINQESPITSGLQEVVLFYPGAIRQAAGSKLNFEPLLTVGVSSGSSGWNEVTKDDRSFSQFTMSVTRIVNPTQPVKVDDVDHVVAARITGSGDSKTNVVFIADLDFVSDWFFRQQNELDEKLDNVSLLYNALDILSGSDQFVGLRNRRLVPRTLTRLEKIFEGFRSEKAKLDQQREEELQKLLDEEQAKLDKDTAKIQGNESIGLGEKLQQTFQRASDSQRRFALKQAQLLRDKKIEDEKSKNLLKSNIEREENRTRWLSVLLAPLPAILLGAVVLWYRQTSEQRDIAADRRV